MEKEKRQYLCDQCDYVSSQSGNLKRHKKSIHEEATRSQFQGLPLLTGYL